MRVVCENCGATYKIPQTKLVKEVNKATCRKCGHRMLIRKAEDDAGADQDQQAAHQGFRAAAAAAAAAAAVPRPEPIARTEWEEEDPTHIAQLDERGEPVIPSHAASAGHAAPASHAAPPPAVPAMPAPMMQAAQPAPAQPAPAQPAPVQSAPVAAAPVALPTPAPRLPAPSLAPAPAAPAVTPAASAPAQSPAYAPAYAAAPAPAAPRAPLAAPAAFDPSGDLGVIGFGVVLAAIGGLLLAVNTDGGAVLRFVGLLLALWGTLTSLFIVVTGSRGRRKAGIVLSTVLGTFFAVVGSAAIVGATNGAAALDSFTQGLASRTPTPVEPATPAPVDQRIDALFAEQPAAAPAELPPPVDPPVADAAAPVAATPVPVEPDRGSAYVAPPAEPARPAAGSSASTSTARTSSASSAGSTSAGSSSAGTSAASSSRTSSPPPAEEAEPASTGGGSGLSTLPPTVVDTMVKSNKNVKKCMYLEYKRAEGNLGTVTIRFKVLSTGKVSSAYVTSSAYKGTELDSCLSAAMYTVVFPAFSGDALTLDVTLGA